MNKNLVELQDLGTEYKGRFNTKHGLIVDINKPTPDMFQIEDVAYGLAGIHRFGGHSRLTVAQHCCIASRMAPCHLKRIALLHDASEAFIGDIISPLKKLIPTYYDIEECFMRQIAERFNFRFDDLEDVLPYDWHCLVMEFDYLFKKTPDSVYEKYCKSYDYNIQGGFVPNTIWSPEFAEKEFLRVYADLMRYEAETYREMLFVINEFPVKIKFHKEKERHSFNDLLHLAFEKYQFSFEKSVIREMKITSHEGNIFEAETDIRQIPDFVKINFS